MIVPDGIDVAYLSAFRDIIIRHLEEYEKIIIVAGGGKTARRYQDAAREIENPGSDDLDWLGIHSSRLNGHLLRTIFRSVADPEMITNPERMIPRPYKVIIAAGYRPGHSTDFVAAMLAKAYGSKDIINFSNIDYVYDADPRINPQAKPVERMDWKTFRALVGDVWVPGSNLPFDPVAARLAQEMGASVVVMNGHDLQNVQQWFSGKPHKGTVISG